MMCYEIRVKRHWRLRTLVVFRRFQDLLANIFGTKHGIGDCERFLHFPKHHELCDPQRDKHNNNTKCTANVPSSRTNCESAETQMGAEDRNTLRKQASNSQSVHRDEAFETEIGKK